VGSGSNPILLVGVASGNLIDGLSAPVCNSTTMTLLKKFRGTYTYVYLYVLYNPPSGSVSCSVVSTTQIAGGASISYLGAQESSQPDAIATNTGTGVVPSLTLSTVANNTWVVGLFGNDGYYLTGSIVKRNSAPVYTADFYDTNATIWPAQSYTMTVDAVGGPTGNFDGIIFSIIPASSVNGLVPQTADTATIATPVVLNTSPSVVSILVQGATANLTTDGAAHTVTTTGGIQIEEGCTSTTPPCVTGFAVDTSAGSAGNEITWVRTGMTTGQYLLENDYITPYTCGKICAVNVTFSRSIFQAGSGGVYLEQVGGGALVVNNAEIVNGERGFTVGGIRAISLSNISSTGMSNTDALLNFGSTVPVACSISNVTQIAATSNQPMITATGDISACSMTGNALLSDSGGTYTPQLIKANSSTGTGIPVWSYNLGKTYSIATPYQGFIGCAGTGLKRCTLEYNVLDGWYNQVSSYVDLIGNLCIYSGTVTVQGCFFPYTTINITSTNDIVSMPTANNGSIMFYYIGPASPGAVGLTMQNYTAVGNGTQTAGDSVCGMVAGEGSGGYVTNTAVFNSVFYGQNHGVCENASTNVWATTGPSGVGVYQNDVFATAVSAYYEKGSGGTSHFDNGTTVHPSQIYGDVALDPKFVNPSRTWATCDAYLGGAGTTTNLFTQLFNRWNGSNPVNYTAQNIYNCMRAGFSPREIRVAGMGAMRPVLIFTGVQ
jgi:hypothetical protein